MPLHWVKGHMALRYSTTFTLWTSKCGLFSCTTGPDSMKQSSSRDTVTLEVEAPTSPAPSHLLTTPASLKVTLVQWECPISPRDADVKLLATLCRRDSQCCRLKIPTTQTSLLSARRKKRKPKLTAYFHFFSLSIFFVKM